ncbi:hypothetical protein S245_065402, partial [Arachis hypogaea]
GNAILSSSSLWFAYPRRHNTHRPPPLPDDTEIGQLSSTPLLVEDDKPSKEKFYFAAAPSDVASSVPGMPYKAIVGLIGTLMEQNAQAFNQISKNIASHMLGKNIENFHQVRENFNRIMKE